MTTNDRPDANASDRADTWDLDPATADIGFSARGFWGLIPVSGRFSLARGSITWGQSETATVLLEIHAASITTGLPLRDRHLREPRFLDVETHPMISFHGRAVASGPMRLEVEGALAVRGAATELRLDVELESHGPDLVATTSTRIDLSALGIAPPLGIVRPHVTIGIRGNLVRSSMTETGQ
ncbi:YceI family protein [Nocardia amikacinitolerans]|uniref:YceI family protein n=1 Tax=Nocardia amikacinitolerans TaxID=756689 RepID=UPI001471B140|nr:YceI family protein [Nocardia amikacinitolerans]